MLRVEADYIIEDRNDGKGLGVYALKQFFKGELITRISGEIIAEHRLHTLQLAPDKHLYDPEFTGCLLHSCDPNAVIFPEKREVWAVKDIAVREAITVDYTTTEDRIIRQFPCSCGASNCRRWITGRKETINADGRACLKE